VGVTRRDLLLGAGGLASALVFGGPVVGAMAEARKLKVIVAGGHPGDPEYGCGGTVARITSLGHQVVLMYLNDGAWPPTDAATRIAEAKKACEILKATPSYAGQTNGHAIVDNQHYEQYAKLIDAEQPDAVFTQWPIDNHRDHRAIAMLTYDAWRQSKEKFALYYYEVSDGEDTLQFSPTHYVDITGTEPVNARPATPTPARRLTGTTPCKTRWPCFAEWKVVTKGRRHLCSSGRVPAILCRRLCDNLWAGEI